MLLREYEFEMAQPPESYENDHAKMVVQLKQPCVVRYLRRGAAAGAMSAPGPETESVASHDDVLRIAVDDDLCQGHGVCVGEAPDLFGLEKRADGSLKVKLLRDEVPPELREKADAAVRYCPTRALKMPGGDER